MKTAVHSSNVISRKLLRDEKQAKIDRKAKKDGTRPASPEPAAPPTPTVKHADKAKEFQSHSSSAPRRLNDIAQAPPEFKSLPRGSAKKIALTGNKKSDSVVSLAQKALMEQEREKAILRYRELKAERAKAFVS